jgi:hypothetical protein
MASKMGETRTPTETIVAAMEEAETATECLIIMTSSDGHILTLGSSGSRIIRLGLIETAKAWIIADMMKESANE